MVGTAKWHGELIADSARVSAWLRKAQVADPTGCDRKPRVSDDSGFVQSRRLRFARSNRKYGFMVLWKEGDAP
jgi:hypothetical protein